MSDHSALARLAEVAQLGKTKAADSTRPNVEMIAVDRIDPDPHQPRTDFARQPTAQAKESLAALAQSLRANGVLQPLRLRKHPDAPGRYLLVIGERRLRAAKEAGIDEVPCFIERDADVADPLELLIRQLTENDQREPLTLYDEARTVHRMVREHGCPPAKLQEALGRSKTWVSNRLRVIEKSKAPTLEALEEGLLSHVEACRLFDLLPEKTQRKMLAAARKQAMPLTRSVIARALDRSRSTREPEAKKPGAQPRAFCHLRLRPEEVAKLVRQLGRRPTTDPKRLRDQLYSILRPETQPKTK